VAAERAGERLDWARDGADWPNRASSRFVDAGGLRWHVQRSGPADASTVLLLHGTGAATHSWRELAPLLAASFDVIAPDLPGHGFTTMPPERGLSLPAMARSVGVLLHTLGASPALIVGHSAGAAIGARMALDGLASPRALIALNGAFFAFGGLPGRVFSPAAQVLAGTRFAPRLIARMAGEPAVLGRLLQGTGSTLDAAGRAAYARLAASPGHVAGALGMMARWDLAPLERELPRLDCELILVVGADDRMVPPGQSDRILVRVPRSTRVVLPGLGHLAHEERPDLVAARILEAGARHGLRGGR
jgi:magnesium chelatase accessory protein